MPAVPPPDIDRIVEIVRYVPETGEFFWVVGQNEVMVVQDGKKKALLRSSDSPATPEDA